MKTNELAEVVQSLLGGNEPTIRDKDRQDVAALADLLRRVPSQSISDFIRFVDSVIANLSEEPQVLLDRIRIARQQPHQCRNAILEELRSLPTRELKDLVVSLNLQPGRTKAELLAAVARYIVADDSGDLSDRGAKGATGDSERIIRIYEQIKAEMDRLTIEEIRTRCRLFSQVSKATLSQVLRRIGYPASGSKADMAATLEDNLIRIKLSHELTNQIL